LIDRIDCGVALTTRASFCTTRLLLTTLDLDLPFISAQMKNHTLADLMEAVLASNLTHLSESTAIDADKGNFKYFAPTATIDFTDPITRRSFAEAAATTTSALIRSRECNIITRGKFWNRETSTRGGFSGKVVKEARIIVLGDPNDPDNEALYNGELPEGARLLAVGTCLEDFDIGSLQKEQPNVIFVTYGKARGPLVQLLETFSSIEWVQTRTSGVDFIASEGLAASNVLVTNCKGMYSSTLAEYTMMACSYFAKDLPRLLRQKNEKNWEKYNVLELRGATFGVIGYGDIGLACAKLAKAYGMRVVTLRRNPKLSMYDPYCDKAYGTDELNTLMSESDYICVAAPLTEATRGMVGAEALAHIKQDAVIINVGRGPIIDEDAMIEALRTRKLKGAGLDVTTIEPLPQDSPLWKLDNVLLSPHCMDKTATFQKESTDFFITENLPRFVRNNDLYNPVDKSAGY
jgi:phosphoglycerate dehydrogenase-like enzyme